MLSQIILLIFLLLLSGFFSSAETALFSISKTKARHLAKRKKTFRLIERMKKNPHKLLSTILIGNNIVNVGAAAMATAITIDIFPNHAVGISTGVMTFFILVFGEVLPKSVATQNNILIATMVIYPVYGLSILFYPIVAFMNFIPKMNYNELIEGYKKIIKDIYATKPYYKRLRQMLLNYNRFYVRRTRINFSTCRLFSCRS